MLDIACYRLSQETLNTLSLKWGRKAWLFCSLVKQSIDLLFELIYCFPYETSHHGSYLHPYFSMEVMKTPQEHSNFWKALNILTIPKAKFSIENEKDTNMAPQTKTF